QSRGGIARTCPCGVAHEHVNLARLQGGEAIRGGELSEFNLVRIVEDGRRYRPAIVDIKAGPAALRIRHAKAGEFAVSAAVENAARLNGGERLGGGRGRNNTR